MVNVFGIFWDSHAVGMDDKEASTPHLRSEAFPIVNARIQSNLRNKLSDRYL